MRTCRCIIIDDEPIAIRVLERHLQAFPEMEVRATFNSATKALSFLRQYSVDLIFSDIEMPLMNGLEFLKALKHQPSVIFTTAYRNYAVEAYDMDVVDYLMKPISLERLGRAINRFYERMCNNAELVDETKDTIINVKVDKKIQRLRTEDITYVESLGDYIIIHHQNEKLISRERISMMEEQLAAHGFVRIHRQYLVALSKVNSITGNMLSIDNQLLPVGRTYRKELKNKLGF